MKNIIATVLFLTSIMAYADNSENECSLALVRAEDWSQLSQLTTDCLNSSIEFTSGLTILCNVDKTTISTEFSEYLKYKKDYEDTVAWFQSLPPSQQGIAAMNKVKAAKEKWETLGQKNKIGTILYKLQSAVLVCNPT